MSPQDLPSELFTLNDATEGMEQESINEGTLRDVIVPTGRVFT